MSLLGAAVSTFATSAALMGKFDMVHIQNATLAGGVAIGSAANLNVSPGGEGAGHAGSVAQGGLMVEQIRHMQT